MRIRHYHRPDQDVRTLEFMNQKDENFKIGFEIEKNNFVNKYYEDCSVEVGTEIHDSTLFWKFERDVSCGVQDGIDGSEAVTHILPLGGVKSAERKGVFALFDEEKTLINNSPANSRCGGHITLSCSIEGYRSGLNLADKLKHNLAIFYALFAKRLKNKYVCDNTMMLFGNGARNTPVHVKRSCVEIRIPNAVRNVEQVKARYDLCFKLMKYSIVEPITWKQFKAEIKPNLKKMYKDEAKIKHVLTLADHFREYLIMYKMNPEIKQYFREDEIHNYNRIVGTQY